MKFNALIAAAALLAGASAAQAVTTLSTAGYTLTYDETTSFGSLAGAFANADGSAGFQWNFDEITVASGNQGSQSRTLALPEFTLTVNPGYVLTGPIQAGLSGIAYRESRSNASTVLLAQGSASLDGGSSFTLPATAVGKVPSSATTGSFQDMLTLTPGPFSSFHVFNGLLQLTASVNGEGSASISMEPQDQLSFRFTAVASAVPEPQTYALMLAGLAALGFMARRRRHPSL